MEEPSWFKAPTIQDVRNVISSNKQIRFSQEKRCCERVEFTVPAELKTLRGNIVNLMTLDLSRHGIGFLHRGPLTLDRGAIITMSSETREYVYRIDMLWTVICHNGMWRTGAKFMKPADN